MNRFSKKLKYILIACVLAVLPYNTIYAAEPVEGEVKDTSQKESIDVFCPTDYPFLLFDDEDGGRQLTSQIFHIANYGKEDVVLDLSNAWMEAKEGVECKKLSHSVEADYKSDSKDIFAFLKVVDTASGKKLTKEALQKIDIPMKKVTPNKKDYILTGDRKPESYQVVLKAANHDKNGKFVSFNPESVFSFYIAGSATPNKKLDWKRGDITFNVNIRFWNLSDENTSETMEENELPEGDQPLTAPVDEEAPPSQPEDTKGDSQPDSEDAEHSTQLPSDDTLPDDTKEDTKPGSEDAGDSEPSSSDAAKDTDDTLSKENPSSDGTGDFSKPQQGGETQDDEHASE